MFKGILGLIQHCEQDKTIEITSWFNFIIRLTTLLLTRILPFLAAI